MRLTNIQNIPREMLVVKKLFEPKLDMFVFADYKAIEMRVLAYYLSKTLRDYTLTNQFKEGLDPHQTLADDMSISRQMAKTLNFSIVYLGGVNTIMKQLGVEQHYAKQLLRDYHSNRPGIKKLVESLDISLLARGYSLPYEEAKAMYIPMEYWVKRQTMDAAIRQGAYIKLYTGRRLHPIESRKALNMLIQGTAAELLKEAMRQSNKEIQEMGLESHLVLSVHDELGWDVKEEEAPYILDRLVHWMSSNPIDPVVPTEVDINISNTTWADKRPLETEG